MAFKRIVNGSAVFIGEIYLPTVQKLTHASTGPKYYLDWRRFEPGHPGFRLTMATNVILICKAARPNWQIRAIFESVVKLDIVEVEQFEAERARAKISLELTRSCNLRDEYGRR
jgi:hypothetical protein